MHDFPKFYQLLAVVVFGILSKHTVRGITCKDESNNNVDWYINFKLPREQDTEDKKIKEGLGYAYLTPSEDKQWQFSKIMIDEKESMIQNTLADFYDNRQEFTYLFYNDQPPKGYSGTGVGHLKGFLIFDDDIGIWVIHSVPKFVDDKKFQFPESSAVYGQMIFCVTYKTSELNKIGTYLRYTSPKIYSKGAKESVLDKLDEEVKTLFTDKPKFITEKPFITQFNLRSNERKQFKVFAKDNQIKIDIYEKMISPDLKTSLFVQTWRRGRSSSRKHNNPQHSRSENTDSSTVYDIEAINMTVYDADQKKNIYFDSHNDHSKWAVSSEKNWICFSDVNHVDSQKKRGGGAVCFSSKPVAKAFRDAVAETNPKMDSQVSDRKKGRSIFFRTCKMSFGNPLYNEKYMFKNVCTRGSLYK